MEELVISVESLFTEQGKKNAAPCHYVVKNTAFSVTVEADDADALRRRNIQVHLVYSSDKSKVELEALKKEHVEWVIAPAGDADSITLNVRIKILSSQVQNSLFALHIVAIDGDAAEPAAEGYSEPIKVVSKPDQIRKKRAAFGEPELEVPSSKRRARGEEILEHITAARAEQDRNLAVVEQLLNSNGDGTQNPRDPSENLQDALALFASTLNSIPPRSRSKACAQATQSLSPSALKLLQEHLSPLLSLAEDDDDES